MPITATPVSSPLFFRSKREDEIHMVPPVLSAIKAVKVRLQEMYGDRLAHVVIYGSHARNEARPESDVDILVILHDDYEVHTELKHLSPLSLDLLEQYGVYVSLQPFSIEETQKRQSPLMINIRAEGMELL